MSPLEIPEINSAAQHGSSKQPVGQGPLSAAPRTGDYGQSRLVLLGHSEK
jgi:hypothetical protein